MQSSRPLKQSADSKQDRKPSSQTPDDRIKHFKSQLGFNPTHTGWYFNLAEAYADKGDLDNAIKNFGLAIKWNTQTEIMKYIETADAYLARGRCYAKLGKHSRALEDFTQAIKEKETDGAPLGGSTEAIELAEIYEARGISFLKSDEYSKEEKAVKDFDKAFDLLHCPRETYRKFHPKAADISYQRAVVTCQRYLALSVYERYKIGPRDWIIQVRIDFGIVLEFYPNHAEANHWRGWAYSMSALVDADLDPEYSQYHYILAIKDYLRAFELEPNNKELYADLVCVFEKAFEIGLNCNFVDIRKFKSYLEPADVDLVLAVMDPALWTCSAQKSVFGSPIFGMSDAKEMALDRVLRFEDKAKKIEGLCQFLIQTTILGNLAYTGTLVSTPSFPKDKFLQKVAQELSKELTVENAAQLKKETLEAFRKDVKLQQALALHHKALHAKLLGLEPPQPQDSKSTAIVVQTRLVESKQMGLELKEIPKAVETAVPKTQPQQPNNAAEPKVHQQLTLVLPEPFWSSDAATSDVCSEEDATELQPLVTKVMGKTAGSA